MGHFDLVLTSCIPRTLETALAMGFAVDEQLEVLGDIPAGVWEEIGHHERWEWEQPFALFAAIIARNGPTARMGQLQYQTWGQALEQVPDSGSVLIISHGRVIEAGLVTCIVDDYTSWGSHFSTVREFGCGMKWDVSLGPNFFVQSQLSLFKAHDSDSNVGIRLGKFVLHQSERCACVETS